MREWVGTHYITTSFKKRQPPKHTSEKEMLDPPKAFKQNEKLNGSMRWVQMLTPKTEKSGGQPNLTKFVVRQTRNLKTVRPRKPHDGLQTPYRRGVSALSNEMFNPKPTASTLDYGRLCKGWLGPQNYTIYRASLRSEGGRHTCNVNQSNDRLLT